MTRVEFSKPYLVALYTMNRAHSNVAANVGEIISRFRVPRDDYYEGEIVEYLTHQGWARSPGDTSDPTAPMIITTNGKIYAEVLIEEGIEAFDVSSSLDDDSGRGFVELQVPAADRVVTLYHNAPEIYQIISEAQALENHLRTANDLGSLSEEERKAAVNEVRLIKEAFDADFVRPALVFERAKTTLQWIGNKAAEAAIGAAAVSLLALIATYFGFAV